MRTAILLLFVLQSTIVNADPDLQIIRFEQNVSRADRLTYSVTSWDTNSTLPNPCYEKWFWCTIGVGFQPGNGEGTKGALLGTDRLGAASDSELPKLRTMGEVAQLYIKKFGLGSTHSTTGPGFGNKPLCYAMKWSMNPSGGTVNLVPGAVCAHTSPPPLNACYVDGPINIDHGTISAGSTSERNLQARISCLREATLRVYVNTPGGTIPLRPGPASAKLRINGIDADRGAIVQVWASLDAAFTITSSLVTEKGIAEGEHQGSAVIVHDFM